TLRLAHLLDNVMTLRRGERGANTLVSAPVALVPLARDVLETFSVLAHQRHITLQLEAPVEINVMADASALRQILLNLLDNAAKHGPSDQTVRLSVTVEGRCARLMVDDEGPGIDERDVPRIWEPFVRLSPGARSGVTGTGIGLSVVRQLTTLHGGRAWVARSPSGGARFIVELPETAYLYESAFPPIAQETRAGDPGLSHIA